MKPASLPQRAGRTGGSRRSSSIAAPRQFSPMRACRSRSARPRGSGRRCISSVDDRGHAAGAIIVLAEIFAGRLQIDQQRHLVARTSASRRCRARRPMWRAIAAQVDRRVGRAADRGVDDDRVEERLAGQDVARASGPPRTISTMRLPVSIGASPAGRDRAPGSPPSRAATCRAPRPASSSSSPCPSCCNSRSTAPTRPPA